MSICKSCGKPIIFAKVDGKNRAMERTGEVYRMDYPGTHKHFTAIRAKAQPGFELYIPHQMTCGAKGYKA